MLLKKTACFLLFLACPLFDPAESVAAYDNWDWNKFYSDTPDTTDPKSVISSGHKGQSITEGTYDGVTFGNAFYDTIDTVENVKSNNNEGTIESGVTTKNKVIGGRAVYGKETDTQSITVQANENKVTFKSGSSIESGSIYGGYANTAKQRTSEAVGNEVVVEQGVSANSVALLVGGVASSSGIKGTASKNIVKICGLTNVTLVAGAGVAGDYGFPDTGTANNNTVILKDVGVREVAGSQVFAETSATANNNTVILNGGTYWYRVWGGVCVGSTTSEAVNNRVELRNGTAGAPDFGGTGRLYGGSARMSTGNSLNFYDVKGMKAGNIGYFQILNYEYSEMHAGDVIMELTGADYEDDSVIFTDATQPTSIAKADVNVTVSNLYGADGQSEFKTGDKVVLLKNENGLDTTGIKTKATITAETGISLTYEVEVQANDTELYLTRTGTKSTVLPGTKAIAEGAAAGLALASESSNATMEFLHDFTLSSGLITPFVHTQASSMRHETGSSINMSTVSLLAGLGTGIETAAGKLSAGAFFEYGKGSYTTNNSFDNRSDIDGDGNSWYMGGGILAKMDFVKTGPGHFYVEGSAHMGTLHNEYDSNDLRDRNGNVAKFDMDSPYYSLHGGLGYVWNMAEGHDLDIYGKYIWTRVQGTDDTLTTKDMFEYDDMDSNRIRLGARYTYKGSERFSPYVGAAFEHEFSGSCESTAYGHPVAAPSFEGSSGMGELGLVMNPSESLPLTINLGVQGYVGQKQGIAGNCTMKYEF